MSTKASNGNSKDTLAYREIKKLLAGNCHQAKKLSIATLKKFWE